MGRGELAGNVCTRDAPRPDVVGVDCSAFVSAASAPFKFTLPAPQRTKVITLMGFNPESAGGLMNVDFVSCAVTATAAQVLALIKRLRDHGLPVSPGLLYRPSLSFADLCAVVEETGRFLLGLPLADTAVAEFCLKASRFSDVATLAPAWPVPEMAIWRSRSAAINCRRISSTFSFET